MAKGKFHEWLTPDGLLLIKSFARDGLTDEEIAAKMGISVATFYNWCNRFIEILEALKKGREPVNVIIEDTFFKTKLQSQYVTETVVETTIHKDADGNITGTTEHKRSGKRFIPADTTAMIFYLKCRMPEKYNDKLKVTIDDKRNGKLAELIEGLKEDDLYTETAAFDEAVANEPPETN